jgi:hypothetical protein
VTVDEIDVIRQLGVAADRVSARSAHRAREALLERTAAARRPRTPLIRRLAPVLAPLAACGLALVVALGAFTGHRERAAGTGKSSPEHAAPLPDAHGRVRALRPDLPAQEPAPTTTAPAPITASPPGEVTPQSSPPPAAPQQTATAPSEGATPAPAAPPSSSGGTDCASAPATEPGRQQTQAAPQDCANAPASPPTTTRPKTEATP